MHDPEGDDRRPCTAPAVIERIIVAVPARDERDTIVRCIRAIDRAARHAELPTHVVIAADSCCDDTAARARAAMARWCELIVLEGTWAGAGGARRAAVDAALACVAGRTRPERIWIANTDADTIVPTPWLRGQTSLADRYRAVAGVVDLDPRGVPRALLDRFRSSYGADGEVHGHVHGANLGVRADAYLTAGGWCPNTVVGEDHGLWGRLVEAGVPVVQTTRVRVVTSGRTTSRVDGGFASDLRSLTRPRADAFASAPLVARGPRDDDADGALVA